MVVTVGCNFSGTEPPQMYGNIMNNGYNEQFLLVPENSLWASSTVIKILFEVLLMAWPNSATCEVTLQMYLTWPKLHQNLFLKVANYFFFLKP